MISHKTEINTRFEETLEEVNGICEESREEAIKIAEEKAIEIIDEKTGRSEVFKLADGVRLHNDIVSNEIHKVLDRQKALDDFEFQF